MPQTALIVTIDEQLKEWNQGDVVLGDRIPFVHIADYGRPITSESEKAAETDSGGNGEPLGTVVTSVPGVAIITQSCDLVRSCRDQPFVKVAVLQEVDAAFLGHVKKGQRPRFAFIPGVADRNLVARLDAISTMEKSVFVGIDPKDRIRGCRTDGEASDLAGALAPNLARFAFPDEFSVAMRAIQDRILSKHGTITRDGAGNPTNEGTLLTELREIRVACAPSWTASTPHLTFYFIFNDRSKIPPDGAVIVDALLKRFKPTGSYRDFDFRLLSLTEMSAETYVSSEPLDLDHLSHPAVD